MDFITSAFDWNQARAFLATAQAGSLSAAARKIGQTQPTLSRQVAKLEADLDVRLFERIGRRLILTPTGITLLEHFETMGEAANRISLTASGQSQTAQGRVSITATDILAAYCLPKALKDFQKIAPKIEIELIADNKISDLQKREADIAIRHVRPTEPELIGKFLGFAEGRIYGSTAYFGQRARPKVMKDLSSEYFISYNKNNDLITYLNNYGASLTHHNIQFVTDSGVAGWEMVKSGLGLGVMMSVLAEQSADIHPVLEDPFTVRFPVWLIAHKELHTGKRFRVVFDFLTDYLMRTIPLYADENPASMRRLNPKTVT